MGKSKKIITLISIGLYLISTGISYAAFNFLNTSPTIFTSPLPDNPSSAVNNNRRKLIEIAGPETEVCPLNGQKYTKVEKNIWENRRPLIVMIENHHESRPQSGLSDTDIIYEAVAEGGTTRFMSVFYCKSAAYESILGPIRSARTYFLDWASEYNFPLYVHVGGANAPGPANALGQIVDYGWSASNDLNQFSIGYPTFWRDYERLGRTVATEHTMYSTTEKLWEIGKDRGFTNIDLEEEEWLENFVAWQFEKDDSELSNRGDINNISYNFWEDERYEVRWQYDKENNIYKRFNDGKEHKDLNENQQLTTKNLIIQFVTERHANDGYPGNVHLLYGTTGTGKILVFNNGQVEKGTWSKTSRVKRTIFYDSSGKEIKFIPGHIWISILPIGNQINY